MKHTPAHVRRRRRKCKLCGGLTHPGAMTPFGLCQACHTSTMSALDAKWTAKGITFQAE